MSRKRRNLSSELKSRVALEAIIPQKRSGTDRDPLTAQALHRKLEKTVVLSRVLPHLVVSPRIVSRIFVDNDLAVCAAAVLALATYKPLH